MSVWPTVRMNMPSNDGLSGIIWREGDLMEYSVSQGRTYRDGRQRARTFNTTNTGAAGRGTME